MIFERQISDLNHTTFHSSLTELDRFSDLMRKRHITMIARHCRPRLSDGRTLRDNVVKVRTEEERDELEEKKRRTDHLQHKKSLVFRSTILSSAIVIQDSGNTVPVKLSMEDHLRAKTKIKTEELFSRVTKSRDEMREEIRRRDALVPGWRKFFKIVR